jgi:hypothetical protein
MHVLISCSLKEEDEKKKKCKVMPEVRGTYFKNTLLPCVKHQHNYFIKHQHPLDKSFFAQLGTLKKKKKIGHHILLL